MNVNEISDEVYASISKNFHKSTKKGLMLTDYQMEVLDKYKIDYNSYSDIKELIYEIDEVLEECDYPEDLDLVSYEINEFNYYNNTKK